jgi:hypothetical protein
MLSFPLIQVLSAPAVAAGLFWILCCIYLCGGTHLSSKVDTGVPVNAPQQLVEGVLFQCM